MQPGTHKPSIIINLDLGDEQKILKIFEGDDLYQVAKKFCQDEGLSHDCIEYLVENISEEYEKKKSQRNSIKEANFIDSRDNFKLSFGNNEDFNIVHNNTDKKNNRIDHVERARDLNKFAKSKESKDISEKVGTSVSPSRKFQSPINDAHSRLYYQGMQNINRKAENLNKIKKEVKKDDMKECTFSPNLGKSRSKSPITKTEDLNSKMNSNIREYFRKKKKLEELRLEQEVNDCSFKPKINKLSSQLAKNNNQNFPGQNFQEKLYNKCKSISQERDVINRSKFDEVYTFHPIIHPKIKVSSKLGKTTISSKNKCSQNSIHSGQIDNFQKEEKLYHPKINKDSYHFKVKQRHEEDVRDIIESSISKERSPKSNSKRKNSFSPKANKLENSNRKIKMLNNTTSNNSKGNQKKTSKINDEIQFSHYLKDLFDLLDDDNDGFISPENISLSKCSLEMLQAYQLVFERIDEENKAMDFNEFQKLIKSEQILVKYTNSLLNGENLVFDNDENGESTEIQSSKHSHVNPLII